MIRSMIVRVPPGGDVEFSARWAAQRLLGGNATRHPDYEEYRPDGNVFRVPLVEQIVFRAVLAPVVGDVRVFGVLEPERMTDEAANLLLKTLEEPPPHLHVLLVTRRFFDLLATVRSRCAVLDAPPRLPSARASDDERRAAWLALATSVSALPAACLALPEPIERLVAASAGGDEEERRRARRERTDDLLAGLELLSRLYREVLAVSLGAPLPSPPVEPEVSGLLASGLGVEGALGALDDVAAARDALLANGTVRLALEVLALRLGARQSS